ncbi:MAG: hypothetical protein DMG17_32620 [Acidobacteria bacterium]|nr:MAG: hypothetical protein DMG17_32620 [Acidobacteriota bacterium]
MRRIKALLDFVRTSPENLLARANAVYTGLNGNPAYTRLPVDLSEFRVEVDAFAAAIAEALDGGKRAFAERKRRGEVVVHMLLQFAHYVEANCNGQLQTFLSSGFQPAPTSRSKTPPLSEAIRKIVPGSNSGELLVTLIAVAEAYSYQLRWAPAGTEQTSDAWTVQPIGNTRPATLIKGLIPATAYVFQVRAVTDSGYTDWSDSVTRICT